MPYPYYRRRSTSRRRTYTGPKRRRTLSSYRRTYRGRGAYKGSAPKSAAVGRQIGSGLGSLVGYVPGYGKALAPLASMAGAKIGQFLGGKLGQYMGWGEYKVQSNSLMVPEGNSPASMHSDGTRVRISHREFIGQVVAPADGSDTFQEFLINPGNRSVFPWLNTIALAFQKYKLLGAILEFKSLTGEYQAGTGASSSLGDIVIASNYNSADPAFLNRQQMENTQFSCSVKPTKSLVHIYECDPKLQAQNQLYVTEGGEAQAGMSLNEVNWCKTTVATFGTQPAGVEFPLGNLYITYDIELYYPVDRTASDTQTMSFSGGAPANPTPGAPLGEDPSQINFNSNASLEVIVSFSTSPTPHNTLKFPELYQGTFLFDWQYTAPSATLWTAPVFGNFVNCELVTDYDINNQQFNYAAPENGISSFVYHCTMAFRVTGGAPSFWFSGGSFIPDGIFRCIVTEIDQDLEGNQP